MDNDIQYVSCLDCYRRSFGSHSRNWGAFYGRLGGNSSYAAYFSLENGWNYHDDNMELNSDSLGFTESVDKWNKYDFNEHIFDSETFISQNATKNENLVKKLTGPDKFDYIPHPEKSIYEWLFDNTVFGYDIPNENNKVGFYILNSEREYLWAGNVFNKIIDFYYTGKPGIDSVNADFHSASDFKDGGTQMMITKSGGKEAIDLWYKKGIFYINNGSILCGR